MNNQNTPITYIVAEHIHAVYCFAVETEKASECISELMKIKYMTFENGVQKMKPAYTSVSRSRVEPEDSELVYLGTVSEMKQKVTKHYDDLSVLLWKARGQAKAA